MSRKKIPSIKRTIRNEDYYLKGVTCRSVTDESRPLHLFVGLKNELKMFVDVEKIDQARMLLNLVVVVVYCEPVSINNSLLTGKFTGNFVVYAVEMEKVTEINASFQVDTKKFPTQHNREFASHSREFKSLNRGNRNSNRVRDKNKNTSFKISCKTRKKRDSRVFVSPTTIQ